MPDHLQRFQLCHKVALGNCRQVVGAQGMSSILQTLVTSLKKNSWDPGTSGRDNMHTITALPHSSPTHSLLDQYKYQ